MKRRLKASAMPSNLGHHCAIFTIRVQALDSFVQRSDDDRITRITGGRVQQNSCLISVRRNAGSRLNRCDGYGAGSSRPVEHGNENAAAVSIGMNTIRRSKKGVAKGVKIRSGEINQDPRLVSI